MPARRRSQLMMAATLAALLAIILLLMIDIAWRRPAWPTPDFETVPAPEASSVKDPR